jgi:hypothetical protein
MNFTEWLILAALLRKDGCKIDNELVTWFVVGLIVGLLITSMVIVACTN